MELFNVVDDDIVDVVVDDDDDEDDEDVLYLAMGSFNNLNKLSFVATANKEALVLKRSDTIGT